MLENELNICKLLKEKREQFEKNELKISKNISTKIIKRIGYIVEKINSKLINSKIDGWSFNNTDVGLFPNPYQRKDYLQALESKALQASELRIIDTDLEFHYASLLGESVSLKITMVDKQTSMKKDELFRSYVFFDNSIRDWNFIEKTMGVTKLSIPICFITDDDFDSNFEKGYIMYQLAKN